MPAAPPARHSRLGGVGVVVATGALGLAVGSWGVAAGVVAALAWYVLPASYAFAVGQLLAAAVLPPDVSLGAVVVAEVGLFAVLGGPLATVDSPVRSVAAFVLASLVIGVVGWSLLRVGRPHWLAALALAAVAATAAYGVHRYGRVRLGLVEGAA